jgi:tetratricopeptide (TPR) repeat protein
VGVAGIGKSRLAWELYKYGDGLAQTVRWHQGRCLAYGDGVTYWALAEMLRMRAGIAEGEDAQSARAKLRATLERHVDDPDERSWMEPRLAQLLALEERDADEQPDLFAGWRLFFERLAERNPVVLVFEDMQWADKPLLNFVDYLLEWSRKHPIFVFALARPELVDRHPAWAVAKRNSTSLTLEPLSQPAMAELLQGYVPGLPDELRDRILEASEGVPLYAVETIRMLLDRGLLEKHGDEFRVTGAVDSLEVPETLHALIAARLDGLTPAERRLTQHAAVLGKTFTRAALDAVATDVEHDELEGLLGALVRKEILSLQADPRSPERGQYGYLQDLLRQVAYETLPRKDRKLRHLAAAEFLEREWLDGDQDLVEIVASHYLSALELDPAAEDVAHIRAQARSTLTRAGARSASLAASDSAQRYFEQALALAESDADAADLHEQAGRMAMLGERTAEARSHFERAIALHEAAGRPQSVARVVAKLGQLTWNQEGDIERAVIDMERSFDVLAEEERSPELATLAAQLARVLFFSGRRDEAMTFNELALEVAEALELPDVLSHGLNTKSVILTGLGRHEEAHVLLRHALEVALANDLSEAALRALNNLAGQAEAFNRPSDALSDFRQMSALARRVGDRGSWRRADESIVRVLVDSGEWDQAFALADELSHEDDVSDSAGVWLAVALLLPILERGELAEARRRLQAFAGVADQGDVQEKAVQLLLEAKLSLAEARPAEALTAADEILSVSLGIGHWTHAAGLEVGLEAASALGDDERLDSLLSLIESTPPGHTTPHMRALGARYQAHRAARQGDSGTALAGFGAAADLLRNTGAPFELAVVLLELAEWLTEAGRAEEAAAPRDEARAIFERLRATPWLERVDQVSTPVLQDVVAE